MAGSYTPIYLFISYQRPQMVAPIFLSGLMPLSGSASYYTSLVSKQYWLKLRLFISTPHIKFNRAADRLFYSVFRCGSISITDFFPHFFSLLSVFVITFEHKHIHFVSSSVIDSILYNYYLQHFDKNCNFYKNKRPIMLLNTHILYTKS